MLVSKECNMVSFGSLGPMRDLNLCSYEKEIETLDGKLLLVKSLFSELRSHPALEKRCSLKEHFIVDIDKYNELKKVIDEL